MYNLEIIYYHPTQSLRNIRLLCHATILQDCKNFGCKNFGLATEIQSIRSNFVKFSSALWLCHSKTLTFPSWINLLILMEKNKIHFSSSSSHQMSEGFRSWLTSLFIFSSILKKTTKKQKTVPSVEKKLRVMMLPTMWAWQVFLC